MQGRSDCAGDIQPRPLSDRTHAPVTAAFPPGASEFVRDGVNFGFNLGGPAVIAALLELLELFPELIQPALEILLGLFIQHLPQIAGSADA